MNDKQLQALVRDLVRAGNTSFKRVGKGLYVRVGASQRPTFAVRYSWQGARTFNALGDYGKGIGQLSLADARERANEILALVRAGIDPRQQAKNDEEKDCETFNDLAEEWLAHHCRRVKVPKIPRRIVEKELLPGLGEKRLSEITARDVKGVLDAIVQDDRPTIANDSLSYLKQIFLYGVKLDLLASNPADAFSPSDAGGSEHSRERALSLEELEVLFDVLRRFPAQISRENYLLVALLVALGVRKGEIIAAQWSEFNLDKGYWDLPGERAKNGDPIRIPLPKMVVTWLDELKVRAAGAPYVFPNRRSSKRPHMSPDTINAALVKLRRQGQLPLEHFTVHDLRRSFRTLLAQLGVAPHIAERCLNHRMPRIERIYNQHDYFSERRDALNRVEELLIPLIEPKPF